jgi:hypothetical protein
MQILPPSACTARVTLRWRELAESARVILASRVHRAHEHAVRQRREAEVERREEMRIRCRHGFKRPFGWATMP